MPSSDAPAGPFGPLRPLPWRQRFGFLRLALVFFTAMAALAACSPEVSSGTSSSADAISSGDVTADAKPEGLKPLTLMTVTPSRGPLSGGDLVDLLGTGFGPSAKVFIADREATVEWRGGTTHVYAVVPPAVQAGVVDVRVENSKTSKATLARSYTYVSEVTVSDFAPERGPMQGGTELIVHGDGFRPGDRVLVGYAEAYNTQFVDDRTLVAMTPAYSADQNVDLAKVQVSVRHASGVTHAKMPFTYGRPPQLLAVQPALVPLSGGTVTLSGVALGNADKLYARGAEGILAPGTASSVRGASVPALLAVSPLAKPGPADVVVTGPYGNHKLYPAFAYIDAASKNLELFGVAPPSGPAVGGNELVLMLQLPEGTQVTAVTIGGKSAPFKQNGYSVTATAPAGPPGSADVEVTTSAGKVSLAKGYSWLYPVVVDQIEPTLGPVSGGTKVLIRGSGFAEDCLVQIGMYAAKINEVAATGSAIEAITPAGAPGAADVIVRCGSQQSKLANGFGYVEGSARINAVSPPSGSTGGGATVKIYGSGFGKTVKFAFGGKAVLGASFIHSGLAEVKVPAHAAGPVAVDVIDGKQMDTLIDGFTYFAPGSPDGGTWGEGVGGTLNVTVLNIYTRGAIEGATVQLGSPGDALYQKYVGITDEKGSVVFSGPDIIPPMRVSATKEQFTASSIMHFDASNATLLLFPYSPPSSGSGGGEPPNPPPLALLKGKVVDLDKYLLVPPANCLGSTDTGDQTCKACQNDSDCAGTAPSGASFLCVDNGAAGKRCLADCSSKPVCGQGFVCVPEPTLAPTLVCKPTMGIRKVFCATSVRDMEAEKDNPPPSKFSNNGALPYETAPVDEITGAWEMTSRLDELAVVCIGGYVSNQTKQFVPTAMGVRRHVFPKPYYSPADAVANLDLRLDVPLSRKMNVRLDHPQAFYGSTPGSLALLGWLDLGSDGLIRLPSLRKPGLAGVTGVQDDIELKYQPLSLPNHLTDTTYTYYAHSLFSEFTEVGPVTLTIHDSVLRPGDDNHRIRNANGTSVDRALGIDLSLAGAVAGSDGKLLFAGRDGSLWRGTPQDPVLFWLPPVIDPYAVPPAVLALAGTPTDATAVGEAGLIRKIVNKTVKVEASGTLADLHAVCQGDGFRVAAGSQAKLLVHDGQVWSEVNSQAPSTVTLRALACTAKGAVAAGDDGWVVTLDLSGTTPSASAVQAAKATVRAAAVREGEVWLAGDKPKGEGPVLLVAKNGAWKDAWPAGVVSPKYTDLRGLLALDASSWLLLDRDGGVLRLDPKAVVDESPERRDLRAHTGAVLPDGTAVLVGQPGLWLGPFLTVPVIAKPVPNSGLQGAVPVEWSTAPGPAASFTRIHVDAGMDKISGWGFPFWWIYANPDISNLVLPDFEKEGITVFPALEQMPYSIRIDRGYIPGFSINGFATLDLEFGRWRSRASNYLDLGQP